MSGVSNQRLGIAVIVGAGLIILKRERNYAKKLEDTSNVAPGKQDLAEAARMADQEARSLALEASQVESAQASKPCRRPVTCFGLELRLSRREPLICPAPSTPP